MEYAESVKMKEFSLTYWWFKGKYKIIEHIIENYKRKKKEKPYILDIGCGTGYFIDKYDGIGIEPNPIFKGQKIINTNIENIKLKDKFNIILCLDVLEHLKDDSIINDIIENNLTSNGIAIITVPSNPKLYSEHDRISGHYRRYTKETLKDLVCKFNCELYYYNTILYPVEYIYRKIYKNESNLKPIPKIVNYILFHIFAFERYTLKINPFGLSLIAIINKKGE